MKREMHRHMFLFATNFSWWLEDLQIALEPAAAAARIQPAYETKFLAVDHRLKSVANKELHSETTRA